MTSSCRSTALLIVATTAFAVGCGFGGPRTYPVAGTVTLNGSPVKHGRLEIRNVEDPPEAARALIEDGNYSLRSTVGKKTVAVYSVIQPDQEKALAENPALLPEGYIPDKYNVNSTLTMDVAAGSSNTFTFDLKK